MEDTLKMKEDSKQKKSAVSEHVFDAIPLSEIPSKPTHELKNEGDEKILSVGVDRCFETSSEEGRNRHFAAHHILFSYAVVFFCIPRLQHVAHRNSDQADGVVFEQNKESSFASP